MAKATPSPLHDLTAFERDILATVAGLNDPCGLDVKTQLDDAYGEELNHGRIYPAFDSLVDMGLIEKSEKDARTNAYSVTPRGRRELTAHQEWQSAAIRGEV